MAIPFCILGVYNMANGLRPVAEILEDVWKELKEFNDRFDKRERANESATTLRPSNDGTTPTGSNEHFKISNRRETDEL
jgi:hypothetical protein